MNIKCKVKVISQEIEQKEKKTKNKKKLRDLNLNVGSYNQTGFNQGSRGTRHDKKFVVDFKSRGTSVA